MVEDLLPSGSWPDPDGWQLDDHEGYEPFAFAWLPLLKRWLLIGTQKTSGAGYEFYHFDPLEMTTIMLS